MHSKTEIEATGENFYAHLERVNGHVVPATQGMLDTLYNQYLQSHNQANQAYQNCVTACNNIANQYNQTRTQDAQNALQQQIQAQQAKEQQARDAYDAKQNRIREDMLSKLEAARQQNQLQQYDDPTARANNLINGSANESSIFAPAFNNSADNSGLDIDQQLELAKLSDMASNYWQSLKNGVSNQVNGLFDNSIPIDQDFNIPPDGWSGNNTSLLQNVTQQIRSAFPTASNYYDQAMQTYQQYKELYDQAQPKNSMDYFSSLSTSLNTLTDQIGSGEITDDDYNTATNNIQANNVGGLLGQLRNMKNNWNSLAGLLRMSLSPSTLSTPPSGQDANSDDNNNE